MNQIIASILATFGLTFFAMRFKQKKDLQKIADTNQQSDRKTFHYAYKSGWDGGYERGVIDSQLHGMTLAKLRNKD